MATLSVQNITTSGLEATYAAATATTGDQFLPADGTFIHVKNGGAGTTVGTLTTPATVDSLAVADRTVSIPAGEERFIATPDTLYRDPTDGLATVVFDVVTSVTLAVVRI